CGLLARISRAIPSASLRFPLSAAATARASASASAVVTARAPLDFPACLLIISNSIGGRYMVFDVGRQAENEEMRRFGERQGGHIATAPRRMDCASSAAPVSPRSEPTAFRPGRCFTPSRLHASHVSFLAILA